MSNTLLIYFVRNANFSVAEMRGFIGQIAHSSDIIDPLNNYVIKGLKSLPPH